MTPWVPFGSISKSAAVPFNFAYAIMYSDYGRYIFWAFLALFDHCDRWNDSRFVFESSVSCTLWFSFDNKMTYLSCFVNCFYCLLPFALFKAIRYLIKLTTTIHVFHKIDKLSYLIRPHYNFSHSFVFVQFQWFWKKIFKQNY